MRTERQEFGSKRGARSIARAPDRSRPTEVRERVRCAGESDRMIAVRSKALFRSLIPAACFVRASTSAAISRGRIAIAASAILGVLVGSQRNGL